MRVLVTGGGGFLGLELVRQLLAQGDEVRCYSRGAHPALAELGARQVRGDLAAGEGLVDALRGVETCFHVAAKADPWGAAADYEAANVEGTRRVLAACRAAGVGKLVFTSSPSVCFDGRDHRRASELPHATRFRSHYARTKAAAERLVLAANDAQLATLALRPHLLIGPGDPHLLPRVVARARARQLFVVGRGDNEVSLTDVTNAAAAHVAAAAALAPGSPCAGRAYFVAQREPVRLWPWLAELLARAGLPPPRGRVPAALAFGAGAACELAWRALHLRGEPPLTRFVAQVLAGSHSYDVGRAERELGYREQLDLAAASERAARWCRELAHA